MNDRSTIFLAPYPYDPDKLVNQTRPVHKLIFGTRQGEGWESKHDNDEASSLIVGQAVAALPRLRTFSLGNDVCQGEYIQYVREPAVVSAILQYLVNAKAGHGTPRLEVLELPLTDATLEDTENLTQALLFNKTLTEMTLICGCAILPMEVFKKKHFRRISKRKPN